jgi:hypothetical protein
MDRASRYVIAREDNVVHVDFDRDSRPPRPPFPGAAALRAGSSTSANVSFRLSACGGSSSPEGRPRRVETMTAAR